MAQALALAAEPAAYGLAPFAFTLAVCPVADPLRRATYLRACAQQTHGDYLHHHTQSVAHSV